MGDGATQGVQGLTKTCGQVCAMNRERFRVREDVPLRLLGTGGSGKSTVLRLIGGLEQQHQVGELVSCARRQCRRRASDVEICTSPPKLVEGIRANFSA
jgi:ABC-type nitrate/sulfonate/bicarbonate transport system ATPase subunit